MEGGGVATGPGFKAPEGRSPQADSVLDAPPPAGDTSRVASARAIDRHGVVRLDLVASIAALAGMTLGALGLLGWILDSAVLKGIVPGWPTLKVNGALSCLLLGGSLWTRVGARGGRVLRLGWVAAFGVAVIAVLSLLEWTAGLDIGIDNLLVQDKSTAAQLHPGRMVPLGATMFLCLALALMLLDVPSRRVRGLAQALIVAVLLLSFSVFVSYLYGIDLTVGYTRVSVNLAVATLVLSLGVVSARPGRGAFAIFAGAGVGSAVARRLVPAAIVIPVVVGFVALALFRAGVYGRDSLLSFQAFEVACTAGMLAAAMIGVARRLERAESDRLRATAELISSKERNDELSKFTYSVSHDLRAPLRSMSCFTRILVDEYSENLPDQARVYLGRVQRSSDRMGSLIDDLLAFARLGRQAIVKQPVDPAEIVSAVLAEQAEDRAGRQVRVIVGDLPCCVADPALLKEIYANLLSNAVKFTRGCDDACIEIGGRPSERGLIYYVADNGVGFDTRYSDKLFGVFQRLHEADQFEGTGIGLALCHRIVTRHGGQIWADSTINGGATFFFTLSEGVSA